MALICYFWSFPLSPFFTKLSRFQNHYKEKIKQHSSALTNFFCSHKSQSIPFSINSNFKTKNTIFLVYNSPLYFFILLVYNSPLYFFIFIVYVIFSHLCVGIPFVHLSPSIYMFHDIHRNDADLPSPFYGESFHY
jgi:hypothetical protein